MLRFILLSSLIILVCFSCTSSAEIPKMINYQGMLTDNSGNPLTDTVGITFRIYDDPSQGNKKWEELQTNVPVINGLFNVILGSANPIDSLTFDEEYWLDITVGTEHMPSRLKFTSVGYAFRAVNCDTALLAYRQIVHFPHLNGLFNNDVPGTEWSTIDMSRIILDLSQYGGPVRVSISFCGYNHTQLRLIDINTGLGLDSTIVTGQNNVATPPHIIVTGPFASVSVSTILALQWRATSYGYVKDLYEVSVTIERLR